MNMNFGPLGRATLVLLLWLCAWMPAQAQGNAAQDAFDHTRTGFVLSGMHAQARCASCHVGGVFKGTPRDCAACHTSGARLATANTVKPVRHIPTNALAHPGCDSCHSTQSFSGARFSHTGVASGSCASCHNGYLAPGKPAAHVPTQAACDSCHRSSAWLPATGFNHAGVAPGSCSTCHNGARATGKPANHVPVTVQACDACHKSGFTSWTPAKLHSNVSVTTQCASCHSGGYPAATGKPATPVHNGVTMCESCHRSTVTWAGAKVDHSTFTTATNCSSCHNGSAASGQAVHAHPGGGRELQRCHGTTTWLPSRWNHTQVPVAGQCSTCHNGSFPPADGRPARHIPYQTLTGVAITNCDSCHKSGFVAWTPARLHSSVSVSTQCVLCHSGTYPPAVGKPPTPVHSGVTVCESCHRSTSTWTAVTFAHSPANAVGTGTCDSCHNGAAATGKPAAHIPVPAGAARCDSCHRSQSSFSTSVTMNHSVVSTALCKSCHNGSYVAQGNNGGAMAKPANHIPELQLLNGASMDCAACHTGTTSWGAPRMNHNNSLGGGAGWCKACHASGTSFLGSMEKKSLTHERKTPPAIDCSESGCHRPLGNKGAAYSKWD